MICLQHLAGYKLVESGLIEDLTLTQSLFMALVEQKHIEIQVAAGGGTVNRPQSTKWHRDLPAEIKRYRLLREQCKDRVSEYANKPIPGPARTST